MKLREATQSLFEQFKSASHFQKLNDFPLDIATFPFISQTDGILPKRSLGKFTKRSDFSLHKDSDIKENQEFMYHVFMPRGKMTFDRAILLMHGLNEKSWSKYLPWAARLSIDTNSPVILFPFAFHMNRAPISWSQPRPMHSLLQLRKQKPTPIEKSSIANVALSERLDNFPHRFYLSGYQTAMDLFKLIESIKFGFHPLFKEGTQVNIFAYSIGAFLSQIMLIADNEKLLADSKLMLFCGGSVFQNMIGESKLIMDSSAFNRLLDYFINNLEDDIQRNKPYTKLLKYTDLGNGFRAMLGEEMNSDIRENAFRKHASKMSVIGLKKDLVIPAKKIVTCLHGKDNSIPTKVDILDFPFQYSHEIPFPSNKDIDESLVDRHFNDVFDRAGQFLC